jgi:hypothetical protein
MRQRREIIILAALFLALIGFTIWAQQAPAEDEVSVRPTTHSSRPEGALALYRWLDAIGYNVQRLEYTEFELDDTVDALFVLSPAQPFNRTQTDRLLEWVEGGGTLIISEDTPRLFGGGSAVLEALEIEAGFPDGEQSSAIIERATILQPLLSDPPVQELLVRTDQVLTSERTDFVPIAGSSEATVLAGLKQGAGYIYISSASYPFTSAGLADENNAAMVLNLLRRVPPGGRILFDEYHHGYFTPPSLRTLILNSPWGRALIYALAILVLYLLLTGRRFGRPVPLREEVARRSSAEYVENMADLFQRGGKREYILRHYYVHLKRRLARPFGLSPAMEDERFVAELASVRDIDAAKLRELLTRMRQPPPDESTLLRLINEADTF